MTKTKIVATFDLKQLQVNFRRANQLSIKLATILAKQPVEAPSFPTPELRLFAKSMTAYFTQMAIKPSDFFKKQVDIWQAILTTPKVGEGDTKPRGDKRFANPLWDENLFFSTLRDQYLGMSSLLKGNFSDLDKLDARNQQRLDFYLEQFLNFVAPGNYLATNPEVLKKAIETNGESLVKGLENLIIDLEDNGGKFGVSLADNRAFEVGKNVATTPGDVVFQNELFQLIEYKATTKTVYEMPLVIFPPWINKYYLLDLQPKNSFIRYAVSQGFNVYVVSWKNPDRSLSDIGFDDYMKKGSLVAFDVAKKITGQKQVNAIGYCVGGTLLACTLAWMKKNKRNDVSSATFFTTLLDFEDPGELRVFIEDKTIGSIEKRAKRDGIVDAHQIKQIFSYLRSNDLVYGPAIRSYMLGEKPPAFDLLYWNGDSPNLPGKMAIEYLQGLYRDNQLVKGELQFGGETLDLSDIDLPIYAVATINDHIAPWKASFQGLNLVSSRDAQFVLAGSGHIAGIINPAGSPKYGHWLNTERPDNLDIWFEGAQQRDGSWWDNWAKWLKAKSGRRMTAKKPGSAEFPVLEPAPGTYVKE